MYIVKSFSSSVCSGHKKVQTAITPGAQVVQTINIELHLLCSAHLL